MLVIARIIMILFSLYLFVGCKDLGYSEGDYIKIEHIGRSDKPISSLVICLKDIPKQEWQKTFVVNQSTFGIIDDWISNNKPSITHADKNDFGVFKVSKVIFGKANAYVLPSSEISVKYFSKLRDRLKLIKGNEKVEALIDALDILIKRIC